MYCPVCGVESTQGLNYCKRCGANLTVALQPAEAQPSAKLTGVPLALTVASLSVATAIVSLGGLATVLNYVEDMTGQANSGDLPRLILILGLMMVTAISTLLVLQVSRLIGASRLAPDVSSQAPKPVIVSYAAPQIPAQGPIVASVTEHTTRTFDPARYSEPRANE